MDTHVYRYRNAFSLVEVVIALGAISFAIIAILGVLPLGLNTSHSAQNDTRAIQISQDILTSVASQAQSNFPHTVVVQPSTKFSFKLDLDTQHSYDTLAADNNGRLIAMQKATDAPQYPYYVTVRIDPNPTGFDSNYASVVTVRVAWQPFATNYREFVRVISKY